MNKTERKNSIISNLRPETNSQTNEKQKIRPKRCHNCQKLIAGEKYVHIGSDSAITL